MPQRLRELSRDVTAAGDDVPASAQDSGEKALAAADELLELEAPRVQQVPLDAPRDVDDIVDAEIVEPVARVEPVEAPRVSPTAYSRPMPDPEELR